MGELAHGNFFAQEFYESFSRSGGSHDRCVSPLICCTT
jgi:hypothetical protein